VIAPGHRPAGQRTRGIADIVRTASYGAGTGRRVGSLRPKAVGPSSTHRYIPVIDHFIVAEDVTKISSERGRVDAFGT